MKITGLDVFNMHQDALNVIFNGLDGWAIIEEYNEEMPSGFGGDKTVECAVKICEKQNINIKVYHEVRDTNKNLIGRKVKSQTVVQWLDEWN
jgi:hypothetical protein